MIPWHYNIQSWALPVYQFDSDEVDMISDCMNIASRSRCQNFIFMVHVLCWLLLFTHQCVFDFSRHCGRLLCGKCSSKDIPIVKFSLNKPVRVCDICFNVLTLGATWIPGKPGYYYYLVNTQAHQATNTWTVLANQATVRSVLSYSYMYVMITQCKWCEYRLIGLLFLYYEGNFCCRWIFYCFVCPCD